MSYAFKAGQSSSKGVKRIAHKEIDKILTLINQQSAENWEERVHRARKHLKKLRALLRLVRNELGHKVYSMENQAYRAASRLLAEVRDGYVMSKALDNLTEHYADQVAADAFAELRKHLSEQYQASTDHLLNEAQAFKQLADAMQQARCRPADWRIKQRNFSAFAAGLQRVYKEGRDRMQDAYAEPVPVNFHAWRKRVKDLGYQMRLFKPLWPHLVGELSVALDELADQLGADHDLAALRQIVLARPAWVGNEATQRLLLDLIDRRRAELEAVAYALGKRIYAEKPGNFVERIARYWTLWRAKPVTPEKMLRAENKKSAD